MSLLRILPSTPFVVSSPPPCFFSISRAAFWASFCVQWTLPARDASFLLFSHVPRGATGHGTISRFAHAVPFLLLQEHTDAIPNVVLGRPSGRELVLSTRLAGFPFEEQQVVLLRG